MSELAYAVTSPWVSLDDSKTNRECFAVNIVSINNGLVTILWSLALLITVAVTVRFPPAYSFPDGALLTLSFTETRSVSFIFQYQCIQRSD